MIAIPISTENKFQVRTDDTQHEISGTNMSHIEAAEIVALQSWPWLRNNLDSTRLGGPSFARVAVAITGRSSYDRT